MTDAQRKYIREYYREYRKRHRAEVNAKQKLANRMRSDPDKARRIEEVKAYYRADLPPVDGVIMDASETRLEIYYNRDGYRYVRSDGSRMPQTALCITRQSVIL